MLNNIHKISLHVLALTAATAILAACSTTSCLEEGEQLYTGMKKIKYEDYERSEHLIDTQAELDAALACAPNGALFGSSYYRTPFPYGLWIYNAFHSKTDGFSKWLTNTFGKAPVLMEEVNPELRTSVARTVLENNGYFRSNVSYDIIEGKMGTTKHDTVPRPLQAKLAYTVDFGPLYRLDSIAYVGFNDNEMSIIRSTESNLKKGAPFSVSNLDAERNRLFNLFRDNGYYHYKPSYLTYRADTLRTPQMVQLQLCKMDSLPEEVSRRWKIGKRTFRIRRKVQEQTDTSAVRRNLTVEFSGKKSPLRPRVILQDLRLRSGQFYSQADYNESITRMAAKGIFASTNITFTADSTSSQNNDSIGIMDMLVDCTLDKPYDFALSANYTHKTSGRSGPGLGMSFAKRNAFRGGELLSFNLDGSAEFQMGYGETSKNASYDLKFDITLDMPRLLMPNSIRRKRRRWYLPPSTLLRTSFETIKRSGFYQRNILSAEMAYNFQTSETTRHSFSPLTLDYSYLANYTEEFLEKATLYSILSLNDILIPKMRYTFSYTSPKSYHNPIYFMATATEAANLTNLAMTACGKGWNEKDKKLFKTAYTQYLRFDLEWRKTWRLSEKDVLLLHGLGGIIVPYGNCDELPFSELYYCGGANDLRGFSTRSIGAGSSYYDDRDVQYLMCNGDIKMMMNLEYRPHLFGSLYGALFVDAGNVWDRKEYFANNSAEYGGHRMLTLKNLGNDIAVDAGFGIRYDLDFFVIRLDWGFVVHAPYDTGKSGYFNMPSFKKGQCINFAIGYPF